AARIWRSSKMCDRGRESHPITVHKVVRDDNQNARVRERTAPRRARVGARMTLSAPQRPAPTGGMSRRQRRLIYGYDRRMKMVVALGIAAVLLVSLSALAPTNNVQSVHLVRVPHDGIQPEAVLDGAGTLHLLYFT